MARQQAGNLDFRPAIHPPMPPRMERSGNPGTRVARHGLALRPWAPD